MEDVVIRVRWAEGQLVKLRSFLEYIEAEPDNELDDSTKRWISEAKKLEREAVNLTETCMKKLEHMQRVWALPFVKFIKLRRMRKELFRTGKKVIRIDQRGKEMASNRKQQEADTLNVQDTISTSKSSIYASATSALRNLELALRGPPPAFQEVYREVSNTRSELLPLLEMLKIVNKNVDELLDERQRAWMHMLQNIFQYIDTTSIYLKTYDVDFSFMKTQFYQFILHMKKQIFVLWSRWHTYRIGPFKGLYGSNIVVPHMEPATLRSTLFLPTQLEWEEDLQLSRFKIFLIEHNEDYKEYEEVLDPIIGEFRIDLVLMDALWKDVKGIEEVDERKDLADEHEGTPSKTGSRH